MRFLRILIVSTLLTTIIPAPLIRAEKESSGLETMAQQVTEIYNIYKGPITKVEPYVYNPVGTLSVAFISAKMGLKNLAFLAVGAIIIANSSEIIQIIKNRSNDHTTKQK